MWQSGAGPEGPLGSRAVGDGPALPCSIVEGERRGKVKWFHDRKGYGFIVAEGMSQDVLVHQTEIRMEGFRNLRPGMSVRFRLVHRERGPVAEDVRIE